MIQYLPTLNALLNGLSATLMVLGVRAIFKKDLQKHKRYLFAAVSTSSLFLISYLTYHFQTSALKPFPGTGLVRTVYLTILISHSILATLVMPLVLVTVILGIKNKIKQHKKWARWTFPIWLYVSVTGVLVYWFLYHLYE